MAATDKGQGPEKAEAPAITYSKAQLMTFAQYRGRRDLVSALLDEGKHIPNTRRIS